MTGYHQKLQILHTIGASFPLEQPALDGQSNGLPHTRVPQIPRILNCTEAYLDQHLKENSMPNSIRIGTARVAVKTTNQLLCASIKIFRLVVTKQHTSCRIGGQHVVLSLVQWRSTGMASLLILSPEPELILKHGLPAPS